MLELAFLIKDSLSKSINYDQYYAKRLQLKTSNGFIIIGTLPPCVIKGAVY